MDLRDIEAVLAVHEHGGWAGAADATFQSASSVSKRVKKVEDAIGEPLFERGSKRGGTGVTDIGEVALPYLEQIGQLHGKIEAYAREAEQQDGAQLRVAYPALIGTLGESELLAGFKLEHPSVQIAHKIRNKADSLAMREKGEVDCCFLLFVNRSELNREVMERIMNSDAGMPLPETSAITRQRWSSSIRKKS